MVVSFIYSNIALNTKQITIMKTTDKMNTLSFSDLKRIYSELEYIGLDNDEIRDFINEYCEFGSNDFEAGNYRFIHKLDIDEIQLDELSSDTYMLGCFNDWFISDTCNINYNVVKALQKAECFDELGQLMIDNGIEELQQEYSRLDGYGHHFSSYDGETNEISLLNGDSFYIFKIS